MFQKLIEIFAVQIFPRFYFYQLSRFSIENHSSLLRRVYVCVDCCRNFCGRVVLPRVGPSLSIAHALVGGPRGLSGRGWDHGRARLVLGTRQDSLRLGGPGHPWPPKTCFDPLMQVQTPKHTLQGPSKGGGRIFQPAFSSLVDLQPSVEPHVFESISNRKLKALWHF